MKKALVLLMAMTLSLINIIAYADALTDIKNNKVFRVCMEAGYMPFGMRNKKDELIGFDVDIIKLMAKELNVELKIIPSVWDNIITDLIDNKCDLIASGMTINEERQKKIDFSNSYISIGQTVLLRKELSDKIKSYKDLNDAKYKVASKLGTTGEAAVKQHIPNATYTSVKLEQEGVDAVLQGKIDAFVYDSPYLAVEIAKHGDGKLVFLDQPFTVERLGWGLRKNNPAFLEWLNSFLANITKDGSKFRLYQQWFKSANWIGELKQ